MNIYRKNIRFVEIFMICFDIPSKLSFLPTTNFEEMKLFV